MILGDAIFKLNPHIAYVRDGVAFDINDNEVEFDLAAAEALAASFEYKDKRAAEYPPITDYLDGVVKGDQAQIDAYIAACQAVKDKYPKP